MSQENVEIVRQGFDAYNAALGFAVDRGCVELHPRVPLRHGRA